MYEQLVDHCTRIADDPNVRLLTMRGSGGAAFVAGTDIAQFGEFGSSVYGQPAVKAGLLTRLASIAALARSPRCRCRRWRSPKVGAAAAGSPWPLLPTSGSP